MMGKGSAWRAHIGSLVHDPFECVVYIVARTRWLPIAGVQWKEVYSCVELHVIVIPYVCGQICKWPHGNNSVEVENCGDSRYIWGKNVIENVCSLSLNRSHRPLLPDTKYPSTLTLEGIRENN